MFIISVVSTEFIMLILPEISLLMNMTLYMIYTIQLKEVIGIGLTERDLIVEFLGHFPKMQTHV